MGSLEAKRGVLILLGKPPVTYTVYADEAWTHTNQPLLRFWRFYGGAMVLSNRREAIESALRDKKLSRGLHGELKWKNVTEGRWERFAEVLDYFFDLVESGDLKFRYMWVDKHFHKPQDLTEYHEEYGYFILYYFFLIFGFGLPWHDTGRTIQIEFKPDELPHDRHKCDSFRQFLLGSHGFARFEKRAPFRIIDVGELYSKEHLILQCVDVIIGAVGFMLNHMHKEKQANGRRGSRTIAKEKLYKRIRERLARIDMTERGTKSYAIGVSTGRASDFGNIWRNRFRQWEFRSRPHGEG